MGFFDSKKGNSMPEWLPELQETQQRFFVFLEKLEGKLKELCDAAIPELEQLQNNDPDIYKRGYARFKMNIDGQIQNIRQKAAEAFDGKVLNLYYSINEKVSAMDSNHHYIHEFRNACMDRYHNQFSNAIKEWSDRVSATAYEDLEIKYKQIIDEYEKIKDKFTCKQCGSPITINQIFVIKTYITCPSCNTQNTFEPSTQAEMLHGFAQQLADQRVQPLQEKYANEVQRERELYMQHHELSLKTYSEKDKKILAQMQAELSNLENKRQQSIANAPLLEAQYLRAKYAEWKKITPYQIEHLEMRLNNELKSIRNPFEDSDKS